MYCRISEPGCADEVGRCPHVCDCVYKTDIPPKKVISSKPQYIKSPYEKSWDEYISHLNILLNKKDERIFKLEKERYWKDKRVRQLEAENEKLKDAIRNHTNSCEICKGHDENSCNYGYTEYCEDCFWYPWADEEKCPNKWELKE